MNVLLMLREEILCLFLMCFLFVFGQLYKTDKENHIFKRICVFATTHVVFDIITTITVNNLDAVPLWLNYVFNAVFYLSAILFAREFFSYVMAMAYSPKVGKRTSLFTYIPAVLYLALLPVLPIDFVEGNGINYSYGAAVFACYGFAFAFFLASLVVILINVKRIPRHFTLTIIPLLVLMISLEVVQIFIPELLFTGAALTMVSLSFFSLENPAVILKNKLLSDALTGVKSRQCYELDMERTEADFAQNKNGKYGLLFCDINDLKNVNDHFGHFEGDTFIATIARILTNNLKSAECLYRLGGDEFMAIYVGKDEELIKSEIESVHEECKKVSANNKYVVSVSIGYAMSNESYDSLKSVLRVADYIMYSNKAQMKKQHAYVSPDGTKLNIAGLTDRVFEAVAENTNMSYLSICNMETNVSRWSKSAVEYFGLPAEFMFDCLNVWLEYVHPDDRQAYLDDITAVFSGKKALHDISYRARNKKGEYVKCVCRGAILKGKNGEPDLFAAALVVAENQ